MLVGEKAELGARTQLGHTLSPDVLQCGVPAQGFCRGHSA